jgi:hypothetical protein
VLELGTYVVPAYAGMLLAEQGHQVTKWCSPRQPDPVQGLRHGNRLWEWINHRKQVEYQHARTLSEELATGRDRPDVVIDNFRAATLASWRLDPADLAARYGLVWVSMRDDFDGRSFDAIAQARAWGDHIGYVPAYLGDTTGGLWLAFKALSLIAAGEVGHHVLRQASCLAKLVEGEAVVDADRDGAAPPWDEPGSYGLDPAGTGVQVLYRHEWVREPYRDQEWRRKHLHHNDGRYLV